MTGAELFAHLVTSRQAARYQSHEAALREIAALTREKQNHPIMGRVYDLANGALWFMSEEDGR